MKKNVFTKVSTEEQANVNGGSAVGLAAKGLVKTVKFARDYWGGYGKAYKATVNYWKGVFGK